MSSPDTKSQGAPNAEDGYTQPEQKTHIDLDVGGNENVDVPSDINHSAPAPTSTNGDVVVDVGRNENVDVPSHKVGSQNHTDKQRIWLVINLVVRAAACVFLLISFAVMAANKHGTVYVGDYSYITLNFDKVDAYKYLLSVTVIAFAYSAYQLSRSLYFFTMKVSTFPADMHRYFDFIGDQVMAYMLMSCASGAALVTSGYQDLTEALGFTGYEVDTFLAMAGASTSMAFLGFVVIAASALQSGFRVVS